MSLSFIIFIVGLSSLTLFLCMEDWEMTGSITHGYMNIWMYKIYNISGVKCISVVLELVRDIHVLKHVQACVLFFHKVFHKQYSSGAIRSSLDSLTVLN